MTHKLKLLCVTVVGAGILALTPAALATTSSSSNDTFAATASLLCATCADGANAQAGDTITIGGSVSNLTRKQQKTTLAVTLTGPDGSVLYANSSSSSLGPGKTTSRDGKYVLSSADAPGTYTLTVQIDGVSTSAELTVG